MNAILSDSDLTPLLERADRAAGRICRKSRLPWFDVEDARQELLLDLLCRVQHYEPDRGPLWSFAAICFRHRVQRLAAILVREQHQRHSTSLDATVPGAEHVTLADTLTNEDGLGAWLGWDVDPVAQAELHGDLDRALATLEPEVVTLCAALLKDGPGCTALGLSRTTIHRRIQDLRCRLLAAGVGSHLGTSRRVRG